MRPEPLRLLLFAVGSLLFPLFILAPIRGEEIFHFNSRPLKRVEALKPDTMLIGNSMLQTRIDLGTLKKLSPHRFYAWADGGSAAARWYLAFKNYVAAAKRKPKSVVIFFRDTELTNTSFRTNGKYRPLMLKMMKGPEPVLKQALLSSRTWREIVWDGIHTIYPPAAWGSYVSEDLAYDNVQKLVIPSEKKRSSFRRSLLERFRLEALRNDLGGDLNDSGIDELKASVAALEVSIEQSLLPDMLRIANENNIRLIFFRVERLSTRDRADPGQLLFLDLLQNYIERNGGVYMSEKDALGALPNDWYADGDHIRRTKKKDYTRLFYRKLEDKLR